MGELPSIGQVADAVSVAPSALRHDDEIGLVTPTTRGGGQRRYTEADIMRLRVTRGWWALGLIDTLPLSCEWEREVTDPRGTCRP